ncbi:PKD domain-containing protein, partial [candidate division GN15 bacterium]|nr:PKD domain-containing protein [candidate division GN15 bacterium]
PGAISLWTGWATIKNCTIENSNGLGIYGRSGAHATIANSTIRNCANGGVKTSLGSWVTMTGTTIENNPQFGIELSSNANSYIENCDFNNNSGTGLNVLSGGVTVTGCTFYGNTSLTYAGGLFVSTWDSVMVEYCQFDYNTGEEAGAIVVYDGNDIFINNSTFAYNSSGINILTDNEYAAVAIDQCVFASSTQGAGIEWYDTSYDIDITCTDSYGNAGGNWVGLAASSLGQSGNIEADPQFCGPASRNYTLYSTSPCLAVNNTCGQLMGLYGQGCTQSLACSAYAISEDSGAAPWTVSFQSNASGGTPPYGYTWDFGDGDTSFVDNPTHTFQSEGTYTVTCEISDQSDQTCTRTIPIIVTAPLTCSLAVSDTSGPAPHDVTLTGFAFGGEPPYYYEWNISGIDSSLYGRVVDFEFDTEGTYTTTLRVWDAREFYCESSVDIVVGASLACQITAIPDSGAAPLEVAFEAIITGGEEPYTYLWDFGDNVTSSEANPIHIYDTDGVYTALLTVGDATDKECASETQVVITPALSCMATAEPDSGTAPLTVTFSAQVDGGEPPYTYYWDFGDGTFDSTGTDSLTYTYETSGQYQAVFTATDSRDSTCVSLIDLTIDSPVQMAISPDSLDFGLDHDTLELTVDNIGDGTLSWQIMSRPPWLTTMPSAGSFSEGTHVVSVMADRSSLEPDLYTGAISVVGGGDTIVVPVTMEVESGQDVITVTPTTLPFEYADASLKIQLCNVSGSTVSWFIENNFDWMSMSPSSGTLGPSECRDINVLISRANLPTGDYEGRFQVRADGDQVLNVRTSMSIPLWNLTKGTHGIHVDEPMCVRFNGLIDTETLSGGLSIEGASQSLNWEHSTDTLHGRTISIVCLSPTQGADFLALQEIRISGQPSLLDMNGVPFLKPQGPDLLFVTGAIVWPGDGNSDGVVDERDILPMGLYFGGTGPARDGSGMSWEPFKGLAHDATGQWQPYKAIYSDADGSGVIDTADVCAITDNWGAQTINASPGNATSTAISSAVFGRLSSSTLESLYNAVCNCPQSEGRSHLEQLLASQIGHASDVLPTSPQLYQNYPNPFNPTTRIDFYLPQSGHVTVSVYNLLGQDVKTLYNGFHPQGSGSVVWDATDRSGKTVSSGTYFYVMEYDQNVRLSGRMILLK